MVSADAYRGPALTGRLVDRDDERQGATSVSGRDGRWPAVLDCLDEVGVLRGVPGRICGERGYLAGLPVGRLQVLDPLGVDDRGSGVTVDRQPHRAAGVRRRGRGDGAD